MQTYKAVVHPRFSRRSTHVSNAVIAQDQIGQVLKHACKREGTRGLRAEDVYKVREILEALSWWVLFSLCIGQTYTDWSFR